MAFYTGMNWLWAILVGAVIGLLADMIVPGVKVGFLGAINVGIIGGFVGGWIAVLLGIGGGLLVQLLFALLGAVIILLIWRTLKRQ